MTNCSTSFPISTMTKEVLTSTEIKRQTNTSYYIHILPESRLGQCHTSKESYMQAVNGCCDGSSPREYTLVVVTECTSTSQRILLGLKLRGFGEGFYNGFGGKLDSNDEDIVRGALRELMEETNIDIQSKDLLQHVGELRFSFEDETEGDMLIHLFHLHNYFTEHPSSDCTVVRGCDEITPMWFNTWQDIPFHQMFADDSIWLPLVLDAAMSDRRDKKKFKMEGCFHYAKGGTATNTILHYHLALESAPIKKGDACVRI